MKLMIFIVSIFSKRKVSLSFYDEAVSEGITDTFREMGYSVKELKIKN
ncbi:MAG: hypothetical protein ABI402_06065 [Ferruginibacter sp.]